MDIELSITGINNGNKQAKIIAAAHALSGRLGLGARIDAGEIEKAHTHKDISKKWVNDHWEYEYPQTENQRRINTANQVELITGIKPLDVNAQNVFQEAYKYQTIIGKKLRQGVMCKWLQNRRVVKMEPIHLTRKQGKPRPVGQIIERIRLLPFVLPIIEKYGHVSTVIRNKSGGYDYELIGKADIDGKKHAISIILKDFGKNNLLYISVFGFHRKIIKSLATAYASRPESLRGFLRLNSVGKSASLMKRNLIIPQISAKSIEKKRLKRRSYG